MVGITLFDDPGNSSPACWHSRGYGLMAANPFGRDKSGFPSQKGKTELERINRGDTLTLRYAVYAHSGDAKAATKEVMPLRIPAQMAIAPSFSTPSTGRNNGMIGVSIENAAVMTNWMPTIAHSVCRQ